MAEQKKYYVVLYRTYKVEDGKTVFTKEPVDKSYKKKNRGWYSESNKDMAYPYTKKTALKIVAEHNKDTIKFYGNLNYYHYGIEEVE